MGFDKELKPNIYYIRGAQKISVYTTYTTDCTKKGNNVYVLYQSNNPLIQMNQYILASKLPHYCSHIVDRTSDDSDWTEDELNDNAYYESLVKDLTPMY